MAVTISRYNHTAKLLLNKEVDLASLKLMLLNASASFTATNTTLAQVTNSGAYQVSGNGWDAGGEPLASVTVAVFSTSGASLDAADIDVTATGGDIGPASGAVIYDDTHTDDAPLWFINFDAALTANDGAPFKIQFNANGIYTITNPA